MQIPESSPIVLTAAFHAKKGQADALGRCLKALVEPTRQEEGCIQYTLHQAINEPEYWFFYEIWRNKADLEAHLQMPYVREMAANTTDLLDGGLQLTFFTPH